MQSIRPECTHFCPDDKEVQDSRTHACVKWHVRACRSFGPSAAAAQLEGSKAFLKVLVASIINPRLVLPGVVPLTCL